MKVVKIVFAGSAALSLFGSVALAQQAMTGAGTITKIDRISGTVAIQQAQSGTVGANTGGGITNEFRVQGASLDAWHAGDKVKFSGTEAGGTKTITKIEKQ